MLLKQETRVLYKHIAGFDFFSKRNLKQDKRLNTSSQRFLSIRTDFTEFFIKC